MSLSDTFSADLQKLTTALPVSVSLQSSGQPLTTGSYTQVYDDTIFDEAGGMRNDVRAVLVPAAAFPAIPARKESIWLDGVHYRVIRTDNYGGITLRINCVRVVS